MPARHAGGDGSTPSGISRRAWSVGVPGAHRFGKAEDRVQFPDGPLDLGSWSNGTTPARQAGVTKSSGLSPVDSVPSSIPGESTNEYGR
jgi:hypothetical protein